MPRGRKKKEDMPRHPSGRINHRQAKQRDNMPVEELTAKRIARLAIAGVHDQDKMQYAESWLGVLYAADVITEAMYVAGNKYQQMFKTFYPQGWPQTNYNAGVDETQAFEPIEDDALDDMDLAFMSASRVLQALGRRPLDLVQNIAVFNRFERFIDTTSNRPQSAWDADIRDRTYFHAGLEALARAFDLMTESEDAKAKAA